MHTLDFDVFASAIVVVRSNFLVKHSERHTDRHRIVNGHKIKLSVASHSLYPSHNINIEVECSSKENSHNSHAGISTTICYYFWILCFPT